MKEATARIKMNKLLELAGWRFFAEGPLPSNIRLEADSCRVQGTAIDLACAATGGPSVT